MTETAITFTRIDLLDRLQDITLEELADFLHTNMVPYEDKREDILRGLRYALGLDGAPGGFILLGHAAARLACCGVVLSTGMRGFVPENLILFVCVHGELRRRGIGAALFERMVNACEGSVKLHVEPDNPARHLYERAGFQTKYVEMRYQP